MSDYSINQLDALMEAIKSQLIEMNTALPGVIESYNNGIASVRPIAKKRFRDGDILDFPVIPNVRVCWPSFAGGTAGVKGPVQEGDNCLIIFAQQAVDGSDDRRSFDLQDAYAVMVNIGTVNADNDDAEDGVLSVFYGKSKMRLSPESMTINSPQITINGAVEINGAVTQSGGALSSEGIVLNTHTHGGVEQGPDDTGPPNP